MMKRTQITAITAQHLSLVLSSLFILLVTLFSGGHALEISSIEDFIDFTNNVNTGSNYARETVYLTNDLDFTGYSVSFEPVGKSNDAKVFRGTFDGNGHVISNLEVSTDKFRFLGVFGYSWGIIIKNLVVDGSCFFNNSMSNPSYSYPYDRYATGGILGWCYSREGGCFVEGCVNMASIKYIGTAAEAIYLGGIVGKIEPKNYSTSIINCANYGSVSCASLSLYQVRIGGIASEVWTNQQISFRNTIKNCVNFGALSQNGEVELNLIIGGISGVDNKNLVYENCLSLGAISYNKSSGRNASVGSIAGMSEEGNLTNCFWDESIGSNASGPRSYNTHQEGTVESFDTTSITNPAVLDILESTGRIKFAVLNLDSRGGSAVGPVLVILNNPAKKGIEPLPTPEREGHTFDGWYNDTGFTKRFNASELKKGNTTLYAKWITNKYAITFIVDGEEYNKIIQEFGSNISFPENPTKEGFTFDGWNDTITTVPAHSVIIEALWIINNYTITFIVDETRNETTVLPYQSNIAYPENPTKEGFTFNGWNDTIATVPAHSVAIEAKWIVNTYTITFIVDETRSETTQEFGSNITYPKNPTKEGFTFDGWNDTITTVPAHNVIIEAKWIVNTYTIIFVVDREEYSKTTQEFGSNITYPKNPTKEGFTFDGWYRDSAFKDKADKEMKVSGNTTLYGRFISTTIRIEFSTKDMSTDEAIRKIEKIAGCTDCFTIVEVKEDNGKAFIIIKFEDVSEAKNFVNDAQSTEEFKSKVIIRPIGSIPDESTSSLLSLPSMAVLLFVFLFLMH